MIQILRALFDTLFQINETYMSILCASYTSTIVCRIQCIIVTSFLFSIYEVYI